MAVLLEFLGVSVVPQLGVTTRKAVIWDFLRRVLGHCFSLLSSFSFCALFSSSFSVFYDDCFSLSLSSLMLLSFSSISPMLSLSSVLFLCLFLLLRLLLLFFILFILPLSCPPLLRPSRLVLVHHIGLLLVIIVSSLSASPSIDSHASSSFFHHVLSQVRYLSPFFIFS